MEDDDTKGSAEPQPDEPAAGEVEIDLDKHKAARREAGKSGPVVRFGGDRFHLPAELPYDLIALMVEVMDSNGFGFSQPLDDTLELLLGSKKAVAKFKKHKPSVDDVAQLLEGVLVAYGVKPGESPASSDS